MSRPLRILISAGEASGDRLGAGLARALRARVPEIELVGMGGDEMAEAGVRLVQHAKDVAVVGLVEVLAHLPALRRVMVHLGHVLENDRPDLVIPVDFPDFNLRLASRAHRAGIPVVYFVSPQVWAWRRGRVRRIRSVVRRMLVLFPFETRFYEEAGVPVTFVGHPAIEHLASPPPREELLARIGLEPGKQTIALLPGSRKGEIARHLPVLLEAARLLRRRHPDLQFVIPRARTLPEGLLEDEVLRSGVPGVRVHLGDYPAILTLCSAGVVASGTATLDAALAGMPMVVIYRMRPMSYLLGRRLVRVDHVALPNLVAGYRLVPELIQSECTPEKVAAALEAYVEPSAAAREVRLGLALLRERLGARGVFDRAAVAVLSELGR